MNPIIKANIPITLNAVRILATKLLFLASIEFPTNIPNIIKDIPPNPVINANICSIPNNLLG